MCVLACAKMHTRAMCTPVPRRSEEAAELQLQESRATQDGYQQPNLGFLEEEQVPFTAELSLQGRPKSSNC